MTIYQKLEQGLKRTIVPPTHEFLHRVSAVLDMSKFPIIASDSNTEKYLPDMDTQIFLYFDSDGCNIYSGIHGVELYLNALNRPMELSEREACVAAGLTPRSGSSEEQWEAFMNTKGPVPHDLWPVTREMSEDQFFAPIPSNVLAVGRKFLQNFTPKIRQIATDANSIRAALKYGPVKIFVGTGTGWNQARPNIVPKTNNPMGHAVLVTAIDAQNNFYIYDQYSPYLKILASDYVIFYAFQTLLTPKTMSNAIFVRKPGTAEFGFYLPKISEDALKDMALNLGREDIIVNGKVDFTKAQEGI